MKLTDHVFALALEVSFGETRLTLQPTLVGLDWGALLIDAGLPHTTGELEAQIKEHGYRLEDVRLLLFSHQDGDHVGGGDHVFRSASPTVLASRIEARPIRGETKPRGPEESRYTPVPVDLELTEGSVIRTAAGPLEVINTPGHTPGHVSLLFRDSGLLIAADALTVNEQGLAGPLPDMSEDMKQAQASIRHLAGYPVRSVHCFHGGYVQSDAATLASLADEMGGSA
jgi:glyoxylase-like metal-dependent hydrolase (beta-lactamase superfamily II)